MGEYAKRLSDGRDIKIGTCKSMYYARYEQRKDFEYPYKLEDCVWRLPMPSEDGVKVGDFENPISWATDKDTILNNTTQLDIEPCGIVSLHSKSGISVNLICPHGGDLPKLPEDSPLSLVYNGKTPQNQLVRVSGVLNGDKEMMIMFSCTDCHHSWTFDWEEAKPYLSENELTKRLFFLVCEYYVEKHKFAPKYSLEWEVGMRKFSIKPMIINGDYLTYLIFSCMSGEDNMRAAVQGDAEYISEFIYTR